MIENLLANIGEDVLSVQPKQILQYQVILRGTLPVKQVLILWEDTSTEECA